MFVLLHPLFAAMMVQLLMEYDLPKKVYLHEQAEVIMTRFRCDWGWTMLEMAKHMQMFVPKLTKQIRQRRKKDETKGEEIKWWELLDNKKEDKKKATTKKAAETHPKREFNEGCVSQKPFSRIKF